MTVGARATEGPGVPASWETRGGRAVVPRPSAHRDNSERASLMRRFLLVSLLLLLPAVAGAQAPVFLPSPLPSTCKIQWDHSGTDVQRWEIRLDGVIILATATPTQSGTTWTVTPCPPMAVATHTLTVAACNVAGCALSAPFSFRLVVQPVTPTNVRLGDQE